MVARIPRLGASSVPTGPLLQAGSTIHHDPPPHRQERAILYAAIEGPTCLAEVFQDTRVIDRHRNDPWLAAFVIAGALDLLDLTGTWPTRAGASMAINSGPRPGAQRWARAVWDAYPVVHGLYYPSIAGRKPTRRGAVRAGVGGDAEASAAEPGSC